MSGGCNEKLRQTAAVSAANENKVAAEGSCKRYLLLIIAAIVNFPTGSAAIWAIFQPYAKEMYHMGAGAANLPFSMYMAAFVIGNILGGQLQSKYKARNIVWAGSTCLCVGLLATAFVPVSMAWLISVTFGLLGGLGGGAAYNVIIATISKWFPDKRGMATGIIVCMVGANGFIMSPICNSLLSKFGFSKAILIVAVLYVIVIALGSWTITVPPTGYMSGNAVAEHADEDGETAENTDAEHNYTASEMIRTRQFYMVAGAMAFGTTAYFLINPMVKSLGAERGLTEMMAVSTVMLVSVMNCVGRLIIPWVSDKFGRKAMLIFLFVASMAAVLGLMAAGGIVYMILAGVIAFGYGGFFGIFPVVAVDQFGSKNSGLNYGIIMIGYGVISLICPYLVTIGVSFAFGAAAVACVLGIILTLKLK